MIHSRSSISVFVVLAVVSALALPTRVHSELSDNLPGFDTLAKWPNSSQTPSIFADTDHDGLYEWVNYSRTETGTRTIIVEYQGSNQYSLVFEGPKATPWATGDLDGDGKSELISQVAYGVIRVYEAGDAFSHPDQLIWSSPEFSSIKSYPAVADTDRDGRGEILHTSGAFFTIFESDGHDGFSEVYRYALNGTSGEKRVADADADGFEEVYFSTQDHRVHAFEASGDDEWNKVWTSDIGMYSHSIEGGRDTDGNGIPELFFIGSTLEGWTTQVYEVHAGEYVEVARFSHHDGTFGFGSNALANLDGIGPEEYIMETNRKLHIYRPVAPGHWKLVQEIEDPELTGRRYAGVDAFDLNQNGRAELVWRIGYYANLGTWPTLVLERPARPSREGFFRAEPVVRLLSPFPNPFGRSNFLRMELNEPTLLRLSIHDSAGRRVRTIEPGPLPAGMHQIAWDGRDDRGVALAGGVYLLRSVDEAGTTDVQKMVRLLD